MPRLDRGDLPDPVSRGMRVEPPRWRWSMALRSYSQCGPCAKAAGSARLRLSQARGAARGMLDLDSSCTVGRGTRTARGSPAPRRRSWSRSCCTRSRRIFWIAQRALAAGGGSGMAGHPHHLFAALLHRADLRPFRRVAADAIDHGGTPTGHSRLAREPRRSRSSARAPLARHEPCQYTQPRGWALSCLTCTARPAAFTA